MPTTDEKIEQFTRDLTEAFARIQQEGDERSAAIYARAMKRFVWIEVLSGIALVLLAVLLHVFGGTD